MSEHWTAGRMVGLDLETTHRHPERARIVTATIIKAGGGEPLWTWDRIVDAGVEVPEEAARVHGVPTHLAATGMPIEDALPEMLAILAEACSAGLPLIVFNARYDLTVLDRECRRQGLATLTQLVPDLRVIDPLVTDKWLWRYRKGLRQLGPMCEQYGVVLKPEEAHTSAADALAALRLAWVLGVKGKVIMRKTGAELQVYIAKAGEWKAVRDDLGRLTAAQRGWALEERARFAEYRRGQVVKLRDEGAPAADVRAAERDAMRIDLEVGWPVLDLFEWEADGVDWECVECGERDGMERYDTSEACNRCCERAFAEAG